MCFWELFTTVSVHFLLYNKNSDFQDVLQADPDNYISWVLNEDHTKGDAQECVDFSWTDWQNPERLFQQFNFQQIKCILKMFCSTFR